MSKNLLYRLFGLRKLPVATRERLQLEGIVFDEEGTSCALAYKNFRGKRKSSGRGWENGAAGSLVISNRTFYVQLPYMIVCDKPIEEAVQHIQLELQGADKLVMKFDVEKLFESSTGELTCHWRTNNSDVIYRYLQNLQSQGTTAISSND